ncbi:MAG: hypothetical protein HYX61_00025 [Gammaproteobacteria bacterium]|jgi:hypothetical protein|nr:hypothetical protein [Gammaproteobacteria bacterium]
MKNLQHYKETFQEDIFYNLSVLNEWKNKLPSDNLYSTAVQLLLFIKKLNQQSIPPQRRYQTLSTITKIICEFSLGISQAISSNCELDKKQRIFSYLNETLYIELAKSYQAIINESIKNIHLYKKILISALENSFFCYYTIIKTATFEHRSIPKGAWQDYHKIYQITLSSQIKKFPEINAIVNTYHYCLLFSISNIHCIPKEEIESISHAINDLSKYLKLSEFNGAATGRYIVNFNKDTGPIFIKNSESIIANCFNLDLTLVIQRLQQLKTSYSPIEIPPIENKFTPSEALLSIPQINFLLKAWSSNRIRIEKRIGSAGTVNVCFGFSACYRYVQEEILNKEFVDSENPIILPTLYKAEIVNISKNGFCLSCQDDILDLAAIGELIAIKNENDSNAKWSLGTIRWMNRNVDDSFYLGVEILCENVRPIKSLILNSNESSSIPTFILPNQLNMPVTIIAPIKSLLPGSNLEFEYEDQIYQASLVKLIGKDAQCDYFSLSFKNMS